MKQLDQTGQSWFRYCSTRLSGIMATGLSVFVEQEFTDSRAYTTKLTRSTGPACQYFSQCTWATTHPGYSPPAVPGHQLLTLNSRWQPKVHEALCSCSACCRADLFLRWLHRIWLPLCTYFAVATHDLQVFHQPPLIDKPAHFHPSKHFSVAVQAIASDFHDVVHGFLVVNLLAGWPLRVNADVFSVWNDKGAAGRWC